MPREQKQPEPEQQAGAPEWMVTFSDCMTLLLTFFVLLLSFSSFDDEDDFRKMSSAFSNQISFGSLDLTEQDAVSSMREQMPDYEIQRGSEKPTLSDGEKNKVKKETKPEDFLRLKTFLVSSGNIFWGNGTVISRNGQKALSDLASYLKEIPPHIVIVSESGPEAVGDSEDIGFERAWAVFDYLTNKKGLDPQQISLSAAGTAAKEYHLNNLRQGKHSMSDRVLEIVLLERSL